MGIQKNVASQKIAVYAYDSINEVGKTGDAANITAEISKDFGASAPIDGTPPTELDATDHPGIYVFDLLQAETNADVVVISAVSSTANIIIDPLQVFTVPPNFNALGIESDGDAHADIKQWLGTAVATPTVAGVPEIDVTYISGDSTAADNLELQYDGTGLIGDSFPFTQAAGAAVGGGLAVNSTMASVTTIQGSQQNLSNASTSDDSRWTGDDDGSGAEFIFRCTPADTSNIPVEIDFEGYYDEPVGSTNTASLQVYNFNTVVWDTVATLTNSSKDEDHEVPLSHAHKAPGTGTLETVAYTIGDVLIKFKQDITETGNACLLIDHMWVGFVGNLVTAEEIVDEWETQSQADPTGFHINVQEWLGTAPAALSDTDKVQTDMVAIHGTALTETAGQLAAGFVKLFDVATPLLVSSDVMRGTDSAALAATAVSSAVWTTDRAIALSDWINGERLDLILDAILADTNELQVDWTNGGRLDLLLDDIPTTAEFNARTLVAASYFDPVNDTVANVTLVATTTTNTDMVAAAPTAVAIRTEIDSNSTQLTAIVADTNELQTDWANGGRLDLILDAASAPTVGEIDTELTSTHGAGNWTTSGGTGSGARAVTITVDDGTTGLESANVRVTKGALTYISSTDSSGDVNSGSGFSLDDGTWTVTITLAGYSFTPVTLVVSADTDITYSMTAVSFPVSNPDQATGYLYTYDEDGIVEADITVNLRFRNLAGTGFAFDTAVRTETSDANGLVTFANLFPGGEYELRRETNGIWRTVTVASDASGSFALPNFWGIDE